MPTRSFLLSKSKVSLSSTETFFLSVKPIFAISPTPLEQQPRHFLSSTSDASPSYLPFTTTPVLLLKDKLNSRTYPALNSTNFARTNMIQTRRSVLGNPYLRNPPIHLARPNSVFGRKAFAPTRPNTRNFAMNPSGHARKNSSTRPLNRTISVTSLIPSTSSPMPILIKPSEDGCTVLCKQHSKLPWRKPSLPNTLPTKTHVLSGKNFASTTIPP